MPNINLPTEVIHSKIYLIRNQRVLLDRDLAELYGVETRVLNQSVKRNINRFPEDFMFQLNKEEFENWKSQYVISNKISKMAIRRHPYAFTEQGVAMLSSVLNSERAITVNIQIMRTFINFRQMLINDNNLKKRLNEMEAKYDKNFQVVFRAIKQLLIAPDSKTNKIGFNPDKK